MKKKKNFQSIFIHLTHYKESSKIILILLILFFFSVISLPAFSQEKKAEKKLPSLDAEMRAEVVERVGELMKNNYIFKETAEKMAEKLSTKLKDGDYDQR